VVASLIRIVAAMDPVNILMVDDQPGKLLSYEAMLSELGENLIKAHSAREAMAALLEHEVAVILLDVSMPEIDGFELAGLVRDHPRSQRTPIIFVSAIHLSDLDKLKGYEAGAVDYVSVPVIPGILRAKVRAFIDLHRKTAELRRLNEELEARVKARTADLEQSLSRLRESEATLREQGDALVEAARRKDEFLALLGHELRNPLAPIRHAVELMRRLPQVERLDDISSVIERQVLHLTRLVDDLLDASRVSRGKIVLSRRVLELTQLLREAVDSVRSIDRGRHVFGLSFAHSPVHVNGDPVRLTQAFINVLGNAIKFTGEGGWVNVSACVVDRQIEIVIADTGQGIEAADLEHVFDMFYQATAASGRDKGGLGLGLTLVRQLVELHDGTVSASSAGPDRGSRFVIHLPIVDAAPDVAAKSDDAQIAPTGAPPRHLQRILIVDDNRDAAQALGELLGMEGAEVAIAFDGGEAIRRVGEFRPHVVLLDIGLPDLDGYQVATALRADPEFRSLIIAMTGWGQTDDKRRTKQAGFDGHLVKPVSINTILETIDGLRSSVVSIQ
jgi:signal transduction histidine kinase